MVAPFPLNKLNGKSGVKYALPKRRVSVTSPTSLAVYHRAHITVPYLALGIRYILSKISTSTWNVAVTGKGYAQKCLETALTRMGIRTIPVSVED